MLMAKFKKKVATVTEVGPHIRFWACIACKAPEGLDATPGSLTDVQILESADCLKV